MNNHANNLRDGFQQRSGHHALDEAIDVNRAAAPPGASFYF
jgi:hypothetical protein